MNRSMMKRRLLCPAKKGFTGNIHNFDEYTSHEELLLPTIIRMSGWLGIKHNTLECWLILQNVPTKADFFVVALRTHPKLRIFFNHHIEESFDFVFSLDATADDLLRRDPICPFGPRSHELDSPAGNDPGFKSMISQICQQFQHRLIDAICVWSVKSWMSSSG